MQADALRASGEAIAEGLAGFHQVLDVGCAVGYLTTFYALCESTRVVIGWDRSARAVACARSLAAERNITNVTYEEGDIERMAPLTTFDAVVSSQTLGNLAARSAALRNIASCLRSDGRLICVERLSGAPNTARFIADAHDAGLLLSQLDFVQFSDLYMYSFYPSLVFSKSGPALQVRLEEAYANALQVCQLRAATRQKSDWT
jgi:SAM-dependent methyltransferase